MVSPTATDVVFMAYLHSDFSRQASLDRSTGLAVSKETSRVWLKSETSKPILALRSLDGLTLFLAAGMLVSQVYHSGTKTSVPFF
jgi:hypothetical protein